MEKVKFSDNYVNAKAYPFPSEDIDQTLKTQPGYFLGCTNAIVSKFFNNLGGVPYNAWGERRPFWELRAYRYGRNNPNKYKTFMIGHPGSDDRKKNTVNISWDILQILPQKMDVVKGYLQKVNYDVNTEAVDYEALMTKKTMVSMAKVLADPRIEEMKQQVNQVAGRQVLQDTDPSQLPGGMAFNSPQDVDVAAQVGVFFLEEEAAIQNLLDKTQYESGSDVINDKIKEDLMTLAVAGKRVYTNQNTNMVLEDYVDPDMAMFPWSAYEDYRDITWAGEIKKYTIARLRKELNIPEPELIKIARLYSSTNVSNIGFYQGIQNDRNRNGYDGGFGMNMMDQIQVDVADCTWFGTKNVNITSVVREKDKYSVVNKVRSDYQLSEKDKSKGKTLNSYGNCTVYKAKMVLGTSHVFDYGEDNDISFKKDSSGLLTPIFPYKFVRTGTSSLVERTISFVDDACLSNYKLRIARMKMPAPPNVYIDKSALEGMKLDGVNYKPAQLLKLLQNEGYLIGDSKTQWGQNNGNGKAVTPIGTDLMSVITGWWEDMARSIDMIEKVTGINDVFAAQTPQRQTGLGVSKIMVEGTQNALTPVVKAYEYIFEQTEQVKVKKWQIVSAYMPEEQRKRLSINRSLQIVKVGSNLQEFDFGIKIEAGSTTEQQNQMIMDLTNIRSGQRQGGLSSGMSEADFLVASNLVRAGKVKQAELFIAAAIDKANAKRQAEQQQAIEQNAQVQQASAAQKQQGDAQNIQIEGQTDAQLQQQKDNNNAQLQIKLAVLRGQQEIQREIVKSQLEGNKKSA